MSYLKAIMKNLEITTIVGNTLYDTNDTNDTINTETIVINDTLESKTRKIKKREYKKKEYKKRDPDMLTALFEAQDIFIQECMPPKKDLETIRSSLEHIINWEGYKLYIDPSDSDVINVTVNEKEYTFNKTNFLNNRKFIFHLTKKYEKLLKSRVWVSIRTPRGKQNSYMILIKKNTRT